MPGNMSQNSQKTTSFMTPLTKNCKSQPKKFSYSLQTRRLAKSFEGLISSLAQLATENC